MPVGHSSRRDFIRPGLARLGQQAFPDQEEIFSPAAFFQVFLQPARVVPVNSD
jgi:hypothetical protein